MQKSFSLTEEVEPPSNCSRNADSDGYEKTKSLASHDSQRARNPFPKIHPFLRNQKKGHYSLSSPIARLSQSTAHLIGQRGDSCSLFDEDDERPPSACGLYRRNPAQSLQITGTGGFVFRTANVSPATESLVDVHIPAPMGEEPRISRYVVCLRRLSPYRALPVRLVPFLSRLRFVPSGRLAPPGLHLYDV